MLEILKRLAQSILIFVLLFLVSIFIFFAIYLFYDRIFEFSSNGKLNDYSVAISFALSIIPTFLLYRRVVKTFKDLNNKNGQKMWKYAFFSYFIISSSSLVLFGYYQFTEYVDNKNFEINTLKDIARYSDGKDGSIYGFTDKVDTIKINKDINNINKNISYNWQLYSSELDGFKINFPNCSLNQSYFQFESYELKKVYIENENFLDFNYAYSISYFPMNSITKKRLNQLSRKFVLTNSENKIVSITNFDLDNSFGNIIITKQTDYDEVFHYYRIFYCQKNIYILQVACPEVNKDNPYIDFFFNSFTLL